MDPEVEFILKNRPLTKADVQDAVYDALRSNELMKPAPPPLVECLQAILIEIRSQRSARLEASVVRTMILIAVVAIAIKFWFGDAQP